jgi:hypothetical protein
MLAQYTFLCCNYRSSFALVFIYFSHMCTVLQMFYTACSRKCCLNSHHVRETSNRSLYLYEICVIGFVIISVQ